MNVGSLRQRTAIDVGGTFTDVLTIGPDGVVHAAKVPTTPADLAAGFRAALAATAGGVDHDAPQELLYSTTLALNALLQHRLPRIGLIVTQGFRDLLETARLPVIDAAATSALPPRLVPLELVREISARTDADGVERVAVVADEVRAIAHEYHALGFSGGGGIAVAQLCRSAP